MPVLSKDQILSANDRKPVKVPIPEWGGEVFLLPLSGEDRDALELWQVENKSAVGFRSQLVARCLCDEEGRPLGFSPAEVQALGQKSSAALERLVDECSRLAAYTRAEVEKLEGNLPTGTSDVSG